MSPRTLSDIIEPTVATMAARDMPFKGVLYAGLMITEDGPKLIEYNTRFGDPECQVLMVRLKDDILTLMLAATDGTLDKVSARWTDDVAMTVVMAAQGYPGSYRKGTEIRNLDEAARDPDIEIFHAGTRADGDRILANGGRVLNVTAVGKTVREARNKAYVAIAMIDWPEGFCRSDIGWRAIGRDTSS